VPITPQPWAYERRNALITISGPAHADGNANLICVVNGVNTEADAALIVSAPLQRAENRNTLGDLYLFELVFSELREMLKFEVQARVIVPTLKRVRERQATIRSVLARAEVLS
jgi:hypothetical protein